MKKLALDLKKVFSGRERPCFCYEISKVSEYEANEIERFLSLEIEKVTADELEDFADVFALLTSDAFLYYLPIVIEVSIRDEAPDLLVVNSFVFSLDRSPNQEYWDDFFLERWASLSFDECESIKEWLWWLHRSDPDFYSRESIGRCESTVELIQITKIS